MISTIKRVWIYSFIALMFCGCEIFELSVDEREFFIAKEWKIESFIGAGKVLTEADVKAQNPAHSLEDYRLMLNEDYTFTRTEVNGETNSGTWSLVSGLTQLKLDISGTRIESYLILDLQVRRLELKFSGSNEVKPGDVTYDGELDMIYILEPVKGQ